MRASRLRRGSIERGPNASARARAKGRQGTPWASCRCLVCFRSLDTPSALNERCNVTGGGEGRELGNGQGGASLSSAPGSVPPPRVKIHQSRVYPATHLHVGVVCSPSLPPLVPPNPAHPLTLSGCECGLHPFLVQARPPHPHASLHKRPFSTSNLSVFCIPTLPLLSEPKAPFRHPRTRCYPGIEVVAWLP